jgi:hypothetical protein
MRLGNDKLRNSVANCALAVAIVMLLLSLLLMCACPGWPAIAAGFAGLGAMLKPKGHRKTAVRWLVICLFATGMHIVAKAREERVNERVRQTLIKAGNTAPATTNLSSPKLEPLR